MFTPYATESRYFEMEAENSSLKLKLAMSETKVNELRQQLEHCRTLLKTQTELSKSLNHFQEA